MDVDTKINVETEVDTEDTTHETLTALWRAALPTAAEIRGARRRLHLKAMFILVLVVISYGGLVIGNWGLLVRMVSAAVLFLGLIAVATSIMHDANHGAFFRNTRMNRLLSYVADGLGTSSWLWKFKHNVLHHGATNIYGVDSDIAQAPFARLSPWQPWRSWHRHQHIYLWPLYGFFTLKNLIIGDIMNLSSGQIGGQPLRKRADLGTIARVIAGKAAHLGAFVVVPILFNPLVGRSGVLPVVVLARRIRTRSHLPVGPLRRGHSFRERVGASWWAGLRAPRPANHERRCLTGAGDRSRIPVDRRRPRPPDRTPPRSSATSHGVRLHWPEIPQGMRRCRRALSPAPRHRRRPPVAWPMAETHGPARAGRPPGLTRTCLEAS